jgi:hypothetical protein
VTLTPAAPADQAAVASRLRAAGWLAVASGLGGMAGVILLAGFFALELHTDDAPLGTASDLAGMSVGLLIPAAVALSAYLPDRRRVRALQAAGITFMAITAVCGPLLVMGAVNFNIENPVSAVSGYLVVGWIALVSRMLRGIPPFGPRVTRLGQLMGLGMLTALVLVGSALPLPSMSWPQLVVGGAGLVIGAPAWALTPVWSLFLGQALLRAARPPAASPVLAKENSDGFLG